MENVSSMKLSKVLSFGKKQILLFKNDVLYRNALWLMLGTVVMSGVGFVFWVIAARLYKPETIGLFITYVSSLILLSNFSLLGFNTTINRYLSNSKNKQNFINTTLFVSASASFFIGLIYVLGIKVWADKISFVKSDILSLLIFLSYVAINTINLITTNIFIAMRDAKFVFLLNSSQSIVKLLLLILLFSLGLYGLIGSYYIATLVTVIIGFFVIYSKYKVRILFTIDSVVIKQVFRYSFINYVVSFVGAFPEYILPILVTSKISPETTAFFYMPNMIVSFLSVIPSSVAKSYFSESSHANKPVSLKRPMALSYCILVPIVTVFFLFGEYILRIFGKSYAQSGYIYLVLILIGALVSVPGYFLGFRLLVKHSMRKLALFTVIGALTNLILYVWLVNYGIVGIGLAIVFGYIQGSTLYTLDYLFNSDRG